jgi:hypothetical protein
MNQRHKNKIYKIGYNIGTMEILERWGIFPSSLRKAERSKVKRKAERRFKKKFKKTYKK